jgi:uncharacterized protein HemY
MNYEDKFALVYSWQQGCFIIEHLKRYIEMNIKSTLAKTDTQYKLVGLFDSYDEAASYRDDFKKTDFYMNKIAK